MGRALVAALAVGFVASCAGEARHRDEGGHQCSSNSVRGRADLGDSSKFAHTQLEPGGTQLRRAETPASNLISAEMVAPRSGQDTDSEVGAANQPRRELLGAIAHFQSLRASHIRRRPTTDQIRGMYEESAACVIAGRKGEYAAFCRERLMCTAREWCRRSREELVAGRVAAQLQEYLAMVDRHDALGRRLTSSDVRARIRSAEDAAELEVARSSKEAALRRQDFLIWFESTVERPIPWDRVLEIADSWPGEFVPILKSEPELGPRGEADQR